MGGSGPSIGPLPGGGCIGMDIGIDAGPPPGGGPRGGNGPRMGGPPEETGTAGAIAGANGGGAIAGPNATGGAIGTGTTGRATPSGGGDPGAAILGGPPAGAPGPVDRTGAPHPRQKRISSGLSLPHRGQLTFTNASDHWNCLTLPAHETQPAFEPDGPQSITKRPPLRPLSTANFRRSVPSDDLSCGLEDKTCAWCDVGLKQKRCERVTDLPRPDVPGRARSCRDRWDENRGEGTL
jgi:hypothetical protein